MIYDSHIHTVDGRCDSPGEFRDKAAAAGVSGGNIFNLYPQKYHDCAGLDQRWRARIDQVCQFTSSLPGFKPFHFLDPTEPDAARQVEAAPELGIQGFKIICDHFDAADVRPVISAIADTGLPVMFHCGVLGNASISSPWNRPLTFECLFAVPGLRFSLAHLGWPWVDEFVGIFGKFELARKDPRRKRAEMFIDLTPGTPGIYRREAFRKLFMTGYEAKNKVLWGSDCSINNYETPCAAWWCANDQRILSEIESDMKKEPRLCWIMPDTRNLWECAMNNGKNFPGRQS